ncbi:hypothetical protein GCM10010503_35180 [Streptomyces lucensis JCM 4490]|uniref:Uncharacterized protein n=1 Tax=Streptomyces lucensis JCM 4490 TaxID=1306176 RepID=A0A918MS84_9ACTN|nr:hypothetical protein [Streptomyces lucensis]GGW55131.1 hypothetical protein GCM10010503_35180 [Streptomyces lucensis JCM 4490]
MKVLLSRAAGAVRDVVSGRQRLEKYGDPQARYTHNRDADLARHYIPTAPQIPVSGPGGM